MHLIDNKNAKVHVVLSIVLSHSFLQQSFRIPYTFASFSLLSPSVFSLNRLW